MLRRSLAPALLAVCVGWAATGCSADDDPLLNGAHVLIGTSASAEGDDARIVGTLVRVGDCIGVENEDSTVLLQWPDSVRVEGDALHLDGQQFRIGDDVDGAGGYHAVPDIGLADVPDSCTDSVDEYAVLRALN